MSSNGKVMPFCGFRNASSQNFDIHWTKLGHQKGSVLTPVKSIKSLPSKTVKVEKPVIVEDEQTNSEIKGGTNRQWLKLKGCLLTESDREAIALKELLNDQHINYSTDQSQLESHLEVVKYFSTRIY